MNTQRLTLICLLFLLLPAASFAGKKAPVPEQKTASINMTVIRNSSGKPVKNAEVVIHLIDNHGKQNRKAWNSRPMTMAKRKRRAFLTARFAFR